MTETKARLSAGEVSAILADHFVETGGRPEFGLVCDKHATPSGAFAGQAPETFIGKHVMLAFPTGYENPEHERMWVLVEGLYTGDTGEQLEGTLDNEPRFARGWQYGSAVAFNVDEIVKVDQGV